MSAHAGSLATRRPILRLSEHTMSDSAPKIHVDDEWKAQAEADREKLRAADARSQEISEARPKDAHGMPPADFRSLMGVLASQALMGLGAYADPESGRAMVDLAGARFAIDLLSLVETKTKGNISAEESQELKQTISELRARFVQVATLVARQQAGAMAAPEGSKAAAPSATAAPASPSPSKPSIIIPG